MFLICIPDSGSTCSWVTAHRSRLGERGGGHSSRHVSLVLWAIWDLDLLWYVVGWLLLLPGLLLHDVGRVPTLLLLLLESERLLLLLLLL